MFRFTGFVLPTELPLDVSGRAIIGIRVCFILMPEFYSKLRRKNRNNT